MSWFTRTCRNMGLMLHYVVRPVDRKAEVTRKVEEKKVNEKVTLRRTTIDEIEIKKDS